MTRLLGLPLVGINQYVVCAAGLCPDDWYLRYILIHCNIASRLRRGFIVCHLCVYHAYVFSGLHRNFRCHALMSAYIGHRRCSRHDPADDISSVATAYGIDDFGWPKLFFGQVEIQMYFFARGGGRAILKASVLRKTTPPPGAPPLSDRFDGQSPGQRSSVVSSHILRHAPEKQ